MPARWLDTPTSRRAAELAIRKIVYRALLVAYLPPPSDPLDARADRVNKVYRPRGAPAPGSTDSCKESNVPSESYTGGLASRLTGDPHRATYQWISYYAPNI